MNVGARYARRSPERHDGEKNVLNFESSDVLRAVYD